MQFVECYNWLSPQIEKINLEGQSLDGLHKLVQSKGFVLTKKEEGDGQGASGQMKNPAAGLASSQGGIRAGKLAIAALLPAMRTGRW